ncbi:MAG: F0F1 ATP synthase subunit B [Gammaproteobacteria bacterium]|nr:F0F1 ATP synthase subunit B [Gammaproteobacteria bacterium]
MNITATLLGQMIAFVLLIWFVNKLLWGPLTGMMAERQKRIADGLAAADRGRHDLELAEKRAKELLHKAKNDSAEVLAQAERRAVEIVEEAKGAARAEGERLVAGAKAEIEQEANRTREKLRAEMVTLAVAGAEKVLGREIDAKAHGDLLNQLVKQV